MVKKITLDLKAIGKLKKGKKFPKNFGSVEFLNEIVKHYGELFIKRKIEQVKKKTKINKVNLREEFLKKKNAPKHLIDKITEKKKRLGIDSGNLIHSLGRKPKPRPLFGFDTQDIDVITKRISEFVIHNIGEKAHKELRSNKSPKELREEIEKEVAEEIKKEEQGKFPSFHLGRRKVLRKKD